MSDTPTSGVFTRIDSLLRQALDLACGLTLILMVTVVLTLVFARYVIHLPIFWGEELARYTMFYMVLLGSALAIRHDSHLRLTLFVDRLSDRARRIVGWIVDVGMLVVVAALFWHGLDLALEDGIMRTPALRVAFFWIYLAFPVGAVLMAIQIVAKSVFADQREG
jgi:TRAP-type C4-dicarboxylate transport system permease small subunit